MTKRLLANSRFWILAIGIVFSINIAGFVQLFIPDGSLQIIRIEQFYGFIALSLLLVALVVSPLTKLYPNASYNKPVVHARRAIGVLSFYYALLHSGLAFFGQLGGVSGISYYNQLYVVALLSGGFALIVLVIMSLTSVDWIIKKMGFKRWKLLHRLVYAALAAIVVHSVLLGSHFNTAGLLSTLTAVAIILLLTLEFNRFTVRKSSKHKQLLLIAVASGFILATFPGVSSAHVLQTDGSIGAILHIKPDDNPQADQLTEYQLTFRDTKQQFSMNDCDCRVALQRDGRTISSAQLSAPSTIIGRAQVTFPSDGVYTLVTNGQPRDATKTFAPFKLSFVVRVGKGNASDRGVPPLLWVGMATMIGLLLLAASRLR